MSLASWIESYAYELFDKPYLAINPNPQLIAYLQANPKMIDWEYLSSNLNAIEFLKQNKPRIDWKQICLNPHPEAIQMIKNHHEHYLLRWEEKRRRIPYDVMLSWSNLSQNTGAVKFLEKYPENDLWFIQQPPYDPNENDYDYAGNPYFENLYPDYQINWSYLAKNSSAMDVLEENPEHIEWSYLSSNTSDRAIDLLYENPDKIDWYWLSQNPSAMDLIEANLDLVNWRQLCKNPNAVELLAEHSIEIDWPYLSSNPNAIWLLEQYRSKLDWRWLCKNSSAGPLLQQNIDLEFDKLDWQWLSANPCIFE
jgi:hypothetical protein